MCSQGRNRLCCLHGKECWTWTRVVAVVAFNGEGVSALYQSVHVDGKFSFWRSTVWIILPILVPVMDTIAIERDALEWTNVRLGVTHAA